MRSIKFRAWDNVADEMFYCGEDVDILFMLGSAGIECADIRNVSPSGDGVDEMEHLNYMQFTGLTDKNGKEIYEQDILEVESFEGSKSVVRVVFDDGCFCHIGYLGDLRTYPLRDFLFNGSKVQVIGNIFQHPHLLEGEE